MFERNFILMQSFENDASYSSHSLIIGQQKVEKFRGSAILFLYTYLCVCVFYILNTYLLNFCKII